MSERGRTLRLFVAAYPPVTTVQHLQTLRAQLLASGLRVVPDKQVHLTLHFIGPTLPGDLDAIAEGVRASCSGIHPFSLRPIAIRTLPGSGEPRVLAAETDAPEAVMKLHGRLAHRLAGAPLPPPSRRYLPHLTLARLFPGGQPPRLDEPISCDPFAVERVWLMRSVLKPGGAEHAPLEAFRLDGGLDRQPAP